MIAKIEKLKNIGNFENYNATGNVSLKRMNIIYAENGAGKTTLARVLHSLATNDNSIIERHKRIGTTGLSEVDIKDDTNRHCIYNGKKWNRPMSEIEVFDSHFVADNVYTGFEITSEQHKGLYQFVVGSTGVSIAKKIERVKTLIVSKNEEVNRQEELIKACTHETDVDTILKLPQIPNLDELISTKEKELSVAKSSDHIIKHALLPIIENNFLSFNYSHIKEVLSITVEGIGKEYLDFVKEHLTRLSEAGIDSSADWVFAGINGLQSDNKCPFCGQDLSGAEELIDGYNQYFSKSYKDAAFAAGSTRGTFEAINVPNYLLHLTTQYKHISDEMEYWLPILELENKLPVFPVERYQLEDKYKELLGVIREKEKNPVGALSIEKLDSFNDALTGIRKICDEVNNYVNDINYFINKLRSSIKAEEDVNKELNNLKLCKARYEKPLLDHCRQYEILKSHQMLLNTINKKLQQRQKAASSLLFQQYGVATNNYLQNVFKTPFQIMDIKDVFKGASKRPNLDYTLTFNGIPILLGDDGNSNTSFKNVLSEGDKNTIAFSFFMAKITQDPVLSDKIIVFDDPLSSLDINRRN